MEMVKTYKTTALVKGQVKKVVITVEKDIDYLDRFDITPGLGRQIERGEVEVSAIKVTARFERLNLFSGMDYIIQVLSKSKKDLLTQIIQNGMENNAVRELVANVLDGEKAIKAFLTKPKHLKERLCRKKK